MRREDQLGSLSVDSETVEHPDEFPDQQRVQAGVQLVDDERLAFVENVEDWRGKKQEDARAV